jgi:hypothetical protein
MCRAQVSLIIDFAVNDLFCFAPTVYFGAIFASADRRPFQTRRYIH